MKITLVLALALTHILQTTLLHGQSSGGALQYELLPDSTITPHDGGTPTGPSQRLSGSFSWVPVSPSSIVDSMEFNITSLNFTSASYSFQLADSPQPDNITKIGPDGGTQLNANVNWPDGTQNPYFIGAFGSGTYSGPAAAPSELTLTNEALGPNGGGNWIAYLHLHARLISGTNSPAKQLLFYKGTRRQVFTGGGRTSVVNWNMTLIVDYDTGEAARIEYGIVNGAKSYSVSHWTNSYIVHLSGSRGGYTAIARRNTQCEIDLGFSTEAVYCSGPDRTLTLNNNLTVQFPVMMSDHGNGLHYSAQSGQPILDTGSFVLIFDRPATMESNKSQETIDTALVRLAARVESLGFVR